MKLISPLSGILGLAASVAAKNVWLPTTDKIYTKSTLDDEDLLFPSNRFNADGGMCPGTTRQAAFDLYKDDIYDFRSAKRVLLNSGEKATVSIKWENKKFEFKNRRFLTAEVDAYKGYVKLKTKAKKDKSLSLNVFKHDFNGGFFFCQRTRDKSYLEWQYGNNEKAARDGFKPFAGFIFTFLYMSDDVDGCPALTGNTFQVVLLLDVKNRSRVVYNYADLKALSTLPTIGMKDNFYGSEKFLEPNGASIASVSDIAESSFIIKNWKNGNFEYVSQSPLVSPPGTPVMCGSTEHCYCGDILEDPLSDNIHFKHPTTGADLTTSEIETHFSFMGYCSRDVTGGGIFMAHGAYGYRGHICYIKPKSAQCSHNGVFDKVFANVDLVDINSVTYSQEAFVAGFVCERPSPAKGVNTTPYWRRIVPKEEQEIIGKLKEMHGRKRRAAKLNWAQRQVRDQKKKAAANKAKGKRQSNMDCSNDNSYISQSYGHTCAMGDRKIKRFPKEDIYISCGHSCQHPHAWTNINDVTTLPWTNVDFARNGVWKCWHDVMNADGSVTADVEVADYAQVNAGGKCKLVCEENNGDADTDYITCANWNTAPGHFEYEYSEVKALAKTFTNDGWSCGAGQNCPEINYPTCGSGQAPVSVIVDGCDEYQCQTVTCTPRDTNPPVCDEATATAIEATDSFGCEIWVCVCYDPECQPTTGENQTDFILVLDESGSVGLGNFNIMKEFAKYFIEALALENNGARMHIITYDNFVANMFTFQDSTTKTKAELTAIVDGYSYGGGGTSTHVALNHVADHLFTDSFNNPNAKDVVILLTDGRSGNRPLLFDAARRIKDDFDTELYTIGIANADITELVNVASSPHSKYLREIDQFADLSDVADEWVLHLCPVVDCSVSSGRGFFSKIVKGVDSMSCADPALC